MFLTPIAVLGVWFRALLAVAIVIGGVWLVREWYLDLPAYATSLEIDTVEGTDAINQLHDKLLSDNESIEFSNPSNGDSGKIHALGPIERMRGWRPALDRKSIMLFCGITLLTISVAGRWLRPSALWAADSEPLPILPKSSSHLIERPDGSTLNVKVFGRENRPTMILTHGWAMNLAEWTYLIASLSDRYRIIAWDLPGLGESSQPDNRDYRLEKLASDLRSVIEFSGSYPVALVGHSIGGMTILTLCRLFPELLHSQVAKIVLVHTTYTNPVRTTSMSGLYTAIEKPIIVPLLYLQIVLSPLVWALTWMSYWNGSIHRSTMQNGFSLKVSRTKLNFTASFSPRPSPAVLARGGLGMLQYDATRTLPTINVPTLIVAAANDPLTPPQASEYMLDNIPDAKLITLQAAKHFGLIEHDIQFANEVAVFCQENTITPLLV